MLMRGFDQQDVVYFFAPKEAARVTISLCASSAFLDAFDTKLYVLADVLAPKDGQVTPVACNDDFCGYQSQLTVSAAALCNASSDVLVTALLHVTCSQGHAGHAYIVAGHISQRGGTCMQGGRISSLHQSLQLPYIRMSEHSLEAFEGGTAAQMDVKAGVGYGIVVDGFAGKFGTYEITVSATKVALSYLAGLCAELL